MILITADLHLSDNPRDAYRFKAMATIRKIMKKNQVKCLLVLGDICEAKNYHSSELVNAVVTEFHKFAKICPVVVLKGNHDYESVNNPFWAFLRRIEGISYVETPTDAQNLPIPPLQSLNHTLFLPHSPNYKKDWARIDLSEYQTVFAHQAFAGAINEAGLPVDGVPLDLFSPWTQIIAGDIHRPQKFHNLIYVGAPYTIDFGDNYEPRVLLLSSKEIQSIPVPGTQKILLDVSTDGNWKAAIQGMNTGDLLKIRFPFRLGGEHSWQEIKDEIRKWADKYKMHIIKIEPIIKTSKAKKVKARTPKSDKELLQAYARHRSINERLLKTGIWLLKKS